MELKAPVNPPMCKHGKAVGSMYPCKECKRDHDNIKLKVSILADEFWQSRGERSLDNLMVRCYRMGQESRHPSPAYEKLVEAAREVKQAHDHYCSSFETGCACSLCKALAEIEGK